LAARDGSRMAARLLNKKIFRLYAFGALGIMAGRGG
jgi:hypothetical protein